MTESDFSKNVHLLPVTYSNVIQLIKDKKPDAILCTMGGQTGLNIAQKLLENKDNDTYQCQILGVTEKTIEDSEDRENFNHLLQRIKEPYIDNKIINHFEESMDFAKTHQFPIIVRPAFTLGGTGGGIAKNKSELKKIITSALKASPISQCIIEKSLLGYKEIEYEVLRDYLGNKMVICTMENFDPVGVHTGDSIVFAPALTLSDDDHQNLRSSCFKLLDSLEIIGACNVQFAKDPLSDNYYVIEVNPRVSRSSALASKAMGYPIARVSALLSIGKALFEIKNPINNITAAMEPICDYIVTKMPKWPDLGDDIYLSTQMQATGEVMAIGSNIPESLLKSYRSLSAESFHPISLKLEKIKTSVLMKKLLDRHSWQIEIILELLRRDVFSEEIIKRTKISPLFIDSLVSIVSMERKLRKRDLNKDIVLKAKKLGFTDKAIAHFSQKMEQDVHYLRAFFDIKPGFRMVDSCCGEFESKTPYYYSTYSSQNIISAQDKDSVLLLGSGGITIGQGIEFDFGTVKAIQSLKSQGKSTITINCNPETTSTDFDVSDRLYFEPLYHENVQDILNLENHPPLIAQFGGQTALNVAFNLESPKVLGTSVSSMNICEDRYSFYEMLEELSIDHPKSCKINHIEDFMRIKKFNFPIIIRPSFVIAGKSMAILNNRNELATYLNQFQDNSGFLVDEYIRGQEIEVDYIHHSDLLKSQCLIMNHIESSGIHSGDSMAVYPARIPEDITKSIHKKMHSIGVKLYAKGILNAQFIYKNSELYLIEINPRSSRTMPFLLKCENHLLYDQAISSILETEIPSQKNITDHIFLKYPVFSHKKMTYVDTAPGPQMKSTGEAFIQASNYKELLSRYLDIKEVSLMRNKNILFSLANHNKELYLPFAKELQDKGFQIFATPGTYKLFSDNGVLAHEVHDIEYLFSTQEISVVINTQSNYQSGYSRGRQLRSLSHENKCEFINDPYKAKEIINVM